MSPHRVSAPSLWITAGCAAVLAVGACSSSTPAPQKTSGSAPSPKPVSAPSSAVMAKMLLQAGDFPAGWKSSPATKNDTKANDQATAATAKCVGGRDTSGDRVTHVASDNFSQGSLQVSSNADSYSSTSDVKADVAILQSPKIDGCLEKSFRELVGTSLPKGATVGAVHIAMKPGSGGGPSNIVGIGTGSVVIKAGGQSTTVYLEVADISGPLVEAEVDAESLGQPIPNSTVAPLFAAVAKRVTSLS